ncbi:centrosome-associated zinc finger protein CP190 isoform X2 [Diabrotica virgifera virgifera]|uniref:Centrosome-associated zinc finger protein CP190 n=1 Tax=Diabrotica virgifera virgifera TaxID=50390 RepID=A0ABM5KMS8_DIAVI|nr:centrosome-associated zinc finger protein CP190 isoform X2 [Diabrotica virgifera virgifera]
MVEQGNKQVRVDNWGTFFLQRLQVFFAKTDYCDLTLQFDGNVQLKVHRLVMNACTEYFQYLEDTFPASEENTIMMPAGLQSDVIVPIVNFLYTGMLEFHVSLYERLFKAAEMMNITILTKLLAAQRSEKALKPKHDPVPPKRQPPPPAVKQELPNTLPGRKVPVWKRKTAPAAAASSPVGSSQSTSHMFSETPQKSTCWKVADTFDNTPKPTRFEWPEDDLPPINFLDTSFEDISYTSKPLLTKEDEEKIKPTFDDLRNNVELPKKSGSSKSATNEDVNFRDIEEFAKEQKIRSAMFEDPDDTNNDSGLKRKIEQPSPPTKKIKFNNKISVETATSSDIDHTKIVAEILKKYPDLVKKNKNIKLKIMPGNKESGGDKKIVNAVIEPIKQSPPQLEPVARPAKPLPSTKKEIPILKKRSSKVVPDDDDDGPWVCVKCVSEHGEVPEFVLYYLYRKHMTDVHDEVFDTRLCKYCGRQCNNHTLMLYHLYTKHALRPPATYNFPKCNKCPYIAISPARLTKHKESHGPNETQCQGCHLAFLNHQFLTSHVRITGHYGKPGRVTYDCHFCMKKLQSGMTLLSHIKRSHYNEALRDGIICFEDIDNLEDLEGEEEHVGYISSEVIDSNAIQKEKVNIISNVKVSPTHSIQGTRQETQLIPLEASSEAEALNNVASGIATSLGLVDIVVLDENEQYILQDGQSEQTEFLIPNLAHEQSFSGQVITTQNSSVIQQGMIQSSTGQISSTDELVMVLADHDYPDGHEGESSENSNIVVLYSHPVDGQEGQYITSQGNLMVNSQTGMLELRNSSIATTTASQMIVTNSVETPIESIELIQREIENHEGLKQEPYFEEDRKPEIHQVAETVVTKLHNMPDIHAESEESQIEVHQTEESLTTIQPEEQHVEPSVEELPSSQTEEIQNDFHEEKDTSEDNVDGTMNVNSEEPMDIDEIENKTAEGEVQDESFVQEPSDEPPSQVTSDIQLSVDTNSGLENQTVENTAELALQTEEGLDIIPPEKVPPELEAAINNEISNSIQKGPFELQLSPKQTTDEQQPPDQTEKVDEPMEVDGPVKEVANEEPVVEQQAEASIEEQPEPVINEPENQNSPEECQEKDQEDSETIENSNDKIITSTVEESAEKVVQSKSLPQVDKSILDDWEDDTDSQQSEKNVTESESQDSQVQ